MNGFPVEITNADETSLLKEGGRIKENENSVVVSELTRIQYIRDTKIQTMQDAGGQAVANEDYIARGNTSETTVGCVTVVKKALIQVSSACKILIRTNIDIDLLYVNNTEKNAYNKFYYLTFFGPTTIPFVLEGLDWIVPEGCSFQVFISTTESTSPRMNVDLLVSTYTNTINQNSENIILLEGDSITDEAAMGTDGTGKRYLSEYHWSRRMERYLVDNSIDVTLINKGLANTTIVGNSWVRDKTNDFDLIKAKLWVIAFGMNDAEVNRGVTTEIFKNELIKRIKRRNAKNPQMQIIIVAPTQTDSPSRVSTIEAYRIAAQEAANDPTLGGESRGVFFYNAGQAFSLNATATADTNFRNTERVAGSRVHPSGLGNALYWENPTNGGLKSVIERTKLYNSK